MMRRVVGVFGRTVDADRAVGELLAHNLGDNLIVIAGRMNSVGEDFAPHGGEDPTLMDSLSDNVGLDVSGIRSAGRTGDDPDRDPIDSLEDLDLPKEAIQFYALRLERGGTFVAAEVPNERAAEAQDIIRRAGGVQAED